MPNTSLFSPVVTQKASGAIYDQIRNMIVVGDLKPGDKLPSERSLMDMMQRSRPTIREALRMLENAGLIQIVPGGGAIVREPSISSIQQPLESIMALQSISDEELFEYRFYIEEMAASWAAQRRTEEDLAALRSCIESLKKLVDDFDAFLKWDVQFRSLIAKASHNRLAMVMEGVIYNIVVNILSEMFAPESWTRRHEINLNVIKDNQRIYDTIASQDSESARQEIRRQAQLFLEGEELANFKKR